MAGKIMGTVITIFFISFLTILIMSYFQHENIREIVNDINYNTAETISTSGIMTNNIYLHLQDSINKFGSYRITLKLEKQIKQGVYDTFFDNGEIIDRHLQLGDRLTIFIENRETTLFERLISASIFLFNPTGQSEFKIRSVKTAVVSKDTRNLVKGYDIIAEIQKLPDNTAEAVFVSTKLNPSGKFYGSSGHPDVPAGNLFYGDTPDESGNTGINYIFDTGDFLEEKVYYPDGNVRLLRFVQQ